MAYQPAKWPLPNCCRTGIYDVQYVCHMISCEEKLMYHTYDARMAPVKMANLSELTSGASSGMSYMEADLSKGNQTTAIGFKQTHGHG